MFGNENTVYRLALKDQEAREVISGLIVVSAKIGAGSRKQNVVARKCYACDWDMMVHMLHWSEECFSLQH